MAESSGVSDAKSKITPEELAERIKLAKEVFARKGRVKLAWAAGAHALRSWPPRDPLELRRLAKARARFTLQGPPPAVKTASKPTVKPEVTVTRKVPVHEYHGLPLAPEPELPPGRILELVREPGLFKFSGPGIFLGTFLELAGADGEDLMVVAVRFDAEGAVGQLEDGRLLTLTQPPAVAVVE